MSSGVITRKDIITDDALQFGNEYAKGVNVAVEANKKFAESLKPIAELLNKQQNPKNNSQYIQAKQQEKTLIEQTNVAYKEQQSLERNLIASIERKKLATESTNRALAKQRFELSVYNKQIKQAAILSSSLATEYQKQAVRLVQLRERYKHVALTQGESSKEARRLLKELTELDKRLKRVDASAGQFQRNVGNYPKAFRSAADAARQFMGAIGLVGGVVLFVRVMKDAMKTVSDFNSGLLNVAKTTGIQGQELSNLADDIIKLSENLEVVGTDKLLEYATVAGQLGVKGSENILKFSEALSKLETASDISGEEGGANIARLLTLVDGGVENIQAFGDEIVKLGNNFAATENEILGNATAIAQSTGQYEFGRQAVLAYAVATKAVGIESELTGSTIGRTLGLMEKAIRTGNGIRDVARLTGLSVEELKTQFKEDSAGVFNAFVKGLNDANKSGQSLNAELEKLGITSIRDQRVIATLATKGFDTLTNAINDSANASGSLNEEFELASTKLENQFARVGIAWDNFILSIEKGDGTLGRLANRTFKFLAENMQTIVKVIFYAVTAWGAYKAMVLLAYLQQQLMNLSLKKAEANAIASAKGVNIATVAWTRFNAVLKANALGLAIAGLTGLIALFNKLSKSSLDSARDVISAGTSISSQFRNVTQYSGSINKLADRYDELKAKTKLTTKEQTELNEIIKELAGNIPGAVTEVDKYSEALGINTDAVRAIAKEEKELAELKLEQSIQQQRKELEKLNKEAEKFNKTKREEGDVWVENVGWVRQVNGELQKVDKIYTRYGGVLEKTTKLNKEETIAYREKSLEVGKHIAELEQLITTNENLLSSMKDVNSSPHWTDIANKGATTEQVKLVQDLQDEISELNQAIQTSNVKDIEGIRIKQKKIEQLQKELDTILGSKKVVKDAAKEEETRLRARYELQKYVIEQARQQLKEAADNELLTYKAREDALAEHYRVEQNLALLNAKAKFDASKKFTDTEKEALLSRSKVSKEVLKKVTDEELLIIIQYQNDLRKLKRSHEDELDSLTVERLKRRAEIEAAEIERQMNEELERENQAFLAKEGIYEDELKAIEELEKKKYQIKAKYAIKGLEAQLRAIEAMLKAEGLTPEQIAKYQAQIAEIKKGISDIAVEAQIENNNKELLSEKEKFEKILALSFQAHQTLTGLANALIERKVQALELEMQKSDERFDKLLSNENLSDKERRRIEEEREKRREALQAKIRKEQRKQAILNKTLAIADIAISTAQAIMKTYAQTGFLGGTVGAAIIGAIGAIQLAAVLATPIPEYFKGTEDHPGGLARVGERQPEVVIEPNKEPYVVAKDSIIDIPRHTKVIPSIDEYNKAVRASMLTSLTLQNKELKDYGSVIFDAHFNDDNIVRQLEKLNRKQTKIIVNQQRVDIPFQLFRNSKLNW